MPKKSLLLAGVAAAIGAPMAAAAPIPTPAPPVQAAPAATQYQVVPLSALPPHLVQALQQLAANPSAATVAAPFAAPAPGVAQPTQAVILVVAPSQAPSPTAYSPQPQAPSFPVQQPVPMVVPPPPPPVAVSIPPPPPPVAISVPPPPPPVAVVAPQAPSAGGPQPQAGEDASPFRLRVTVQDVDAFVERSHEVVEEAISNLTEQRETLRARLEKIESDLKRLRKVANGLEPEAPPAPEIPSTPETPAAPTPAAGQG